MKKSTFIGNLLALIVLAVASTAFLMWYHMTDKNLVDSAISSLAVVQVGTMLAAPVLLYAIGAIIGLVFVWLKGITFGKRASTALRVVSALVLLLFVITIVPVFVPGSLELLMGPVVVVLFVSRLAPLFLVMLGFLFAMALAPARGAEASSSLSEDSDGWAA